MIFFAYKKTGSQELGAVMRTIFARKNRRKSRAGSLLFRLLATLFVGIDALRLTHDCILALFLIYINFIFNLFFV